MASVSSEITSSPCYQNTYSKMRPKGSSAQSKRALKAKLSRVLIRLASSRRPRNSCLSTKRSRSKIMPMSTRDWTQSVRSRRNLATISKNRFRKTWIFPFVVVIRTSSTRARMITIPRMVDHLCLICQCLNGNGQANPEDLHRLKSCSVWFWIV